MYSVYGKGIWSNEKSACVKKVRISLLAVYWVHGFYVEENT